MVSDGAAYFPETIIGQSDVGTSGPSFLADLTDTTDLPSTTAQDAPQSDEILLTEAAHGSKDALGFLFRRYRRTVLNIAGRILKDPAEAEDLCQEVFLLLFQKARLFEAHKGTAASWIIQITYHRSMNRRKYLSFRQHYNIYELNEEQTGVDQKHLPFDEIAGRTLLNDLQEQLSAEQLHTLELHFFEGYSLKEIAEKTNQTLGNVRNHYYRGLERIRTCVFPQKDA